MSSGGQMRKEEVLLEELLLDVEELELLELLLGAQVQHCPWHLST